MYNKAVILCAGILLLIAGFFYIQVPHAQATAGAAVTGQAWSSNYGWISFDPGEGGVFISSTGDFSGYAWANPNDPDATDPDTGDVVTSDNIGWISFQETTGCPTSPCLPHVNFSTGQVTGWAKVLSNGEWISLSGTNQVSPTANGTGGVTYNPTTKTFSGYAWGAKLDSNGRAYGAGWINFNPGSPVECTTCGVSFTINCSPDTTSASPYTDVNWTVSVTDATDTPTYSWQFSPAGDVINPSGVTDGDTAIVQYKTAGTKQTSVQVTLDGQTYTQQCPDVVVSGTPKLNLSCSVSPTHPSANQNVTWTAHPTNGTAPYTYNWSGDVIGSSETVTSTYTSGTQTATANVTSQDGLSGTCNLTASACANTCSADGSEVLDCNGSVVAQCTSGSSCSSGSCVAPPSVDLKIRKHSSTGAYVNSNNLEIEKDGAVDLSWTSNKVTACTRTSLPSNSSWNSPSSNITSGTTTISGLTATTWFNIECVDQNAIDPVPATDKIRVIVKNANEN